jgi:hypothetical protein
MLDIVTPDQHELTLAIKVVGVDDAEPGLALPPPGLAAQPQASALDLPHEQAEQREKHENDDDRDNRPLRGRKFQSEQALQGMPLNATAARTAVKSRPLFNTLAIA